MAQKRYSAKQRKLGSGLLITEAALHQRDKYVASPSSPISSDRCSKCGALVRIVGLDANLCSSTCGWVVNREWLGGKS